MKSKIVLFLIVLFLSAIGISAQPGCGYGYRFNPFSICGMAYPKDNESVFYGEVLAYERSRLPKAIIKINKIFKGKLPKEIEIIFNENQIYCGDLPVKSSYIFMVNQEKINGQTVYSVKRWSSSVSDYSKSGLNEVFTNIQTVLHNKKRSIFQGYVLEVSHSKNPQMSQEAKDRLLYDPDFYRTFPDVAVEAKSEASGKLYRTKTNKEGKYVFDKLPLGKYRVTALIKDREVFPETVEIIGKICYDRYNIAVAAIK